MALEAIMELLAELIGKGVLSADEVHHITNRAKDRAALKSLGRA